MGGEELAPVQPPPLQFQNPKPPLSVCPSVTRLKSVAASAVYAASTGSFGTAFVEFSDHLFRLRCRQASASYSVNNLTSGQSNLTKAPPNDPAHTSYTARADA